MNISKIMFELRQQNNLTQAGVVCLLANKGIKLTPQKLSYRESGKSKITAEEFLALCEIYNVQDIKETFTGVSAIDNDLLKGLNFTGRQHAKDLIAMLKENSMFTTTQPVRVQHKYIDYYDTPAAAGYGSFLGNPSSEKIKVDDTVPKDADFAIRISGDSMEPRFLDNQIVFVKAQDWLEVGDIGIFALNDESFIKEWGGDKLISLNKKYNSIKLKEFDELKTFGKVVG